MIIPYFDYCCTVFNDSIDDLNSKLQNLFNSSIRLIFDLKRDVYISSYRVRLMNTKMSLYLFNKTFRLHPEYLEVLISLGYLFVHGLKFDIFLELLFIIYNSFCNPWCVIIRYLFQNIEKTILNSGSFC